jgi:hypothetical protein
VPLIFPVEIFSENIFNSSSKEKIIKVFKEKAKIKTIITIQLFMVRARMLKVKVSRKDTKSRNLYPPSLLNILGAVKSAKIEPADPRA